MARRASFLNLMNCGVRLRVVPIAIFHCKLPDTLQDVTSPVPTALGPKL